MARKIQVKGSYNEAIVFTDKLEDGAYEQIKLLCDQEFCKDSKIRIMPDVHAGAGCTIGTTMTVQEKIVPNLVGVDIGCGMETIKLANKNINLEKLDKLIYSKIPSGFKIRNKPHEYIDLINLNNLKCIEHGKFDLIRASLSLGTLGGGNHFIECNKDEETNIYLVVHSGSRNIGLQVAQYYQKLAYKKLNEEEREYIPKELAYLTGEDKEDYIHDMKIMQTFAKYNRKAIMDELITGMELLPIEEFTTIHNYIDLDHMILRKGAVSAREGEKFLIPINMRDGSLICLGKGNKDWNYSAPHGAGRLLSRNEAKRQLSIKDFKEQMKNIYTTSVHARTLDEAPMAYKDIKDIIDNIEETANIVNKIKAIYNFKG